VSETKKWNMRPELHKAIKAIHVVSCSLQGVNPQPAGHMSEAMKLGITEGQMTIVPVQRTSFSQTMLPSTL
jgi:hypothetical protein